MNMHTYLYIRIIEAIAQCLLWPRLHGANIAPFASQIFVLYEVDLTEFTQLKVT